MTSSNPLIEQATSDLRHRSANFFQLLSALARMRSQKSDTAEARRQLLWMADAIGSLGALERHRTEAGVDFQGYLNEMVPVWRRRYGARAPELRADIGPMLARDFSASTIALIAQELVANAATHGFPDGRTGEIHMVIAPESETRWVMTVEDDGVGYDPVHAAEGFGLWFIRSLATQIHGTFTLEGGVGTTARLVFTP
jgi:two-component sensor histidine kinase